MPLTRLCLPLLTLLGLAIGPLTAAEGADDANAQADQAAPEAEETVDQAERALEAAFGSLPLVQRRDGVLAFALPSGDGPAYPLVAMAQRAPVVETPIGLVVVEPELLAEDDASVLTDFSQILVQAEAAGIAPVDEEIEQARFRFDRSILVGRRLRGENLLVIPDGFLPRAELPESDRSAVEERLAASFRAAEDAVAASDIDRLGKQVAEMVLDRARERDTEGYELDQADPTFARRVIRHGWLGHVLDGAAVAGELEAALEAAAEFRATTAYRGFAADGAPIRVEFVADLFGNGGWVAALPEVTRVGVHPPAPFYHWRAQDVLPRGMIVLDLPPDVDPALDGSSLDQLRGARFYVDNTLLVWWDAETGFAADLEAWRRFAPASGNGLDPHIVTGYLPPHIPVVDLHGDVDRIITAHGSIAPPADDSQEAGLAFLDRAAEVLVDAAHLDLIGQYLFKYVYDSPDPSEPLLIGTAEMSGDIHQTALQTLSTVAGGQCRGDCDDLSELYQQILDRQGKTAHVISLPAHAAVAWADEHPDGWHVYVMQTGPTLEFSAPRLQDALAAAYTDFDATDTFDPNGLGLLLRFSGENTRSAWRLSYRIFSEPDYAETMIDVQRDWHYQTYLQGIRKMEEMIAGGDEDTANFRELAGLANFTGQYALAADYMEQAIERTAEADSRLFESGELIHHYLNAGLRSEAETVLADVLAVQLPALRDQLGPAVVQFGLQLAGYAQDGEAPEIGVRVLDEVTGDIIDDWTGQLVQFVQQNYNEQWWNHHPRIRLFKRILRWHAGTAIGNLTALERSGAPVEERLADDEALAELVARVQRWVDHIALRDIEDPSEALISYAELGAFYQAMIGREAFRAQLAAAPEAGARLPDPASRKAGLDQMTADLPWIRLSPAYWAGELGWVAEFAEADAVDAELAAALATGLEEAIAASSQRGLEGPMLDRLIHNGRVIAAMLTEDADALREVLELVAAKNDKRLRDNTAQYLGDCARFASEQWWDTVMAQWVEILDYKPKYYWIAWRAALHDAEDRALQVAALAAERFSDDPAFVEEYAFMRQLFAADDEPAEREAAE